MRWRDLLFRSARLAAALGAMAVALGPSAAEEALQPWQMVRSLQLVQDRIADGDQAALPMQRKLLEMIDKRLQAATKVELADPHNFEAVLVYAMGGGNPRTIQALMPDLLAAAKTFAPPPSEGEEGAEGAEEAEPAEDAHGGGGHGEEAKKETGHGDKAEHGSGHGAPAANEGHGEADAHSGEEKDQGEAGKPPPPPSRDEAARNMALGVFNYGRGQMRYASQALAGIDAMRERPELGGYLALIQGSLRANEDPAAALKFFDKARLLAPGTLVEEAALRRSVVLAGAVKDRGRFLLASGQYVRRFLHSPYASQFADALVSGVVALHQGLDLEALAGITADMEPEQERVVYLRIARRAAIDNFSALSRFASAKAGAVEQAGVASADARADLYAALPAVTGGDPVQALAKLESIDAKQLTAGDRALLAAAKAVAGETIAAPAPEAPAEPTIKAAALEPSAEPGSAAAARVIEEPAHPAPLPAEPAVAPAATERPAESVGEPAPRGGTVAEEAPRSDAEAKAAAVRRSLEAVDVLLKEISP